MRHKKTYREMETSRADMTDFRRPPYTVQRAIRAQSDQIRETPAQYVARKCKENERRKGESNDREIF